MYRGEKRENKQLTASRLPRHREAHTSHGALYCKYIMCRDPREIQISNLSSLTSRKLYNKTSQLHHVLPVQ